MNERISIITNDDLTALSVSIFTWCTRPSRILYHNIFSMVDPKERIAASKCVHFLGYEVNKQSRFISWRGELVLFASHPNTVHFWSQKLKRLSFSTLFDGSWFWSIISIISIDNTCCNPLMMFLIINLSDYVFISFIMCCITNIVYIWSCWTCLNSEL